jgi:phosphomethylpyrimidine synthase
MKSTPTFLAAQAQVDPAAIAPLPNSRKVHVTGSRPDLRLGACAPASKLD